MKEKDLLKLVFELGVLARTPRTGPYHVGITNHETAAAHSYRQMALAYFMAQEEGADTGKVLKMCLVNDFPETRTLEQTFVQKKYHDAEDAAPRILKEQMRGLKGSEELAALRKEMKAEKTLEAQVAADACRLETLVEAKEYVQLGATVMERWFLDKKKVFRTATGKKLFAALEKENIYWWQD